MKIGIVTQPLGRNYGGILQNWALQQVLIKIGHRPVTILYQGIPCRKKYYNHLRSILAFIVKNAILHPRRGETLLPWQSPPYSNLKRFVSRRIKQTAFMSDVSSAELKKNNIQTVILGSDQIWRPAYNVGYLDIMFCKDIALQTNIKCFTYAASFGTDDWEFTAEETMMAQSNIKKFASISVRERSGIDLCKRYLDADATQVLDPTLLLSKNEYNLLVKGRRKDPLPTGFVGVYLLDVTPEKKKIVEFVSRLLGMTPIYFGIKDAKTNEYQSVEDWLSAFEKSSFIITDSFHGTVFSLIYHRPFLSIANIQRGKERFDSLLSMVNLTDRIVTNYKELREDSIKSVIDWTIVDNLINNYRTQSVSYLVSNIDS